MTKIWNMVFKWFNNGSLYIFLSSYFSYISTFSLISVKNMATSLFSVIPHASLFYSKWLEILNFILEYIINALRTGTT